MTPRPFPHINRRLGATPLITLVSFLSASSCLFSFRRLRGTAVSSGQTSATTRSFLCFIFSRMAPGSPAGGQPAQTCSHHLIMLMASLRCSLLLLVHLRHLMKPLRCASASPTDAIDRKTHPRTGRDIRRASALAILFCLVSHPKKKNVFSFE